MALQELSTEKFKGEKLAVELKLLLKALENRNLTETSIAFINDKVKVLNDLPSEAGKTRTKLSSTKNVILKHLEKQYKLVIPNYYATLWLPLGMTAFGLPIGTGIFALTGNAAFIGIGLPIGMAFGSFYGASLDKKAAKEGRVLNFTVK